MAWGFLFILVFPLIVSAQSQTPKGQTSITWQGHSDTVPPFVYFRELLVAPDTFPTNLNGPGLLVCRNNESIIVHWRYVSNNTEIARSSSDGEHFEIWPGTNTAVKVLVRREDAGDGPSGFWPCRPDGFFEGSSFAGIYAAGEGVVSIDNVTMGSSSFLEDPPRFTLVGFTRGGPPTTRSWTRDGVPINDTDQPSSRTIFPPLSASIISRTLTVTSGLPGVYQYSVSNRATTPPMMSIGVNIQAEPAPTDLTLEQTGVTQVTASWTPPSPPSERYRIVVDGQSEETDNIEYAIMRELSAGQHTVQVRGLSRTQLPSAPVEETITVLGALPVNLTISSRTSTSLTIAWTQPTNSLPVLEYRVNLTAQGPCPNPESSMESRTNSMSITFSDLQVFTEYSVTVVAMYTMFGNTSVPSSPFTTTTLEAAPTGPPLNVAVTSKTSRNITIIWEEIECTGREGIITGYAVEFRPSGGTVEVIMQDNTTLSYTGDGLTPFTDYTIRVAGVNSAGTGVYSNTITIRTDEDIPGAVSGLTVQPKFSSIVLTWNLPQEPNGEIISYEITYRVNDSNHTTENATDTTFTISSLTPGTRVFATVSAYTSAGRGAAENITTLTLSEPPEVMNVEVTIQSATSVQVSWNRLPIPEITRYIVYYRQTGNRKRQSSEQSVTVLSSQNSVVISDLIINTEYQFEVVAVAELDGDVIVGPRSSIALGETTAPPPTSEFPLPIVIGAAVFGVVVIVVLLLLIVCMCMCTKRRHKSKPTTVSGLSYMKAAESDTYIDMTELTAPVFLEFPEETQAIEGEGVFFKVAVCGDPEPSLTWFHEDSIINSNYAQEIQPDGSLSIPTTEMKLSGMYRLVASNSQGSVERQVKLFVQVEAEEEEKVMEEKKVVEFAPVPVQNFGQYVADNHTNSNGGFRDQFQGLETGDHYSKQVGLSPEFKKLNRFANITVYDVNRVTLAAIPGHTDCEREFINACFVDGYSLPRKFLTTQGPIPKTIIDFWRLVWQERPPTIVMVTNLKEGNKNKCQQYWPESGSKHYGPFKVTLTDSQIFADYCIRTLQVNIEGGSGRPLKLKQFHFTAWPDHGVPDYATPMLAFHRRIAASHRPKKGPMLVHCSAGVGRTGTFICIDSVLEQIKKENEVDIAGTINKMRHQRMKMVQTVEQYIFIHDAILESVTCGNTEMSSVNLRLLLMKMIKVDPATNCTQLQTQFKVLEQVSPKQSEVVCSSAQQNMDRNRSDQHLPSDKYRVIMSGEYPDYIHAVSVNGYKHKKAYIIAEGPMESTARNMWKVIHDRKCGAIVMLSDLVENGDESSCKYWPPGVGRIIKYEGYTVDMLSKETLEGFTIRSLSVLNNKTQKAHQVTQFHITCWGPDGQCSNLKSVVDTIEEIAKVQRKTGNKPILVHCSDTVTRSGMFCAMATVIDRCKTEGVVDVFQVVKALRVQKPGAVPTVEQYKTIFDTALAFLDSFDTYANFQ